MWRAEGQPRRAPEVQPHWSHNAAYFLTLTLSLLAQDLAPSSGTATGIADAAGRAPGLLTPEDPSPYIDDLALRIPIQAPDLHTFRGLGKTSDLTPAGHSQVLGLLTPGNPGQALDLLTSGDITQPNDPLTLDDPNPRDHVTGFLTSNPNQVPFLLTPGGFSQAADHSATGNPRRTHARGAQPSLSGNLATAIITADAGHNTTAGTNIFSHRNLVSGALLSLANPGTLITPSNTITTPTASATSNTNTIASSNTPSSTACLDQVVSGVALNGTFVSFHSGNGRHENAGPSPTPGAPCNSSLALEEVGQAGLEGVEPFLFDRGDVRGVLIALYTVVFVTGFVGNLVVLVVMWVHPRMRSTTNFFLTNLAIADFCVTVFCVYQNLSQYLAQTWIFGDFLCKMYNFVNYLSYTASVMILVVNCVERYLAIMCPFRAKTLLSHRNLVASLAVVWAGSGVYCCPRLLYFRAGSHQLPGAHYTEVICLADRELYDSRTFDTINFVLLYVMPLTVMSLLYWRIGSYLWINGRQVEEEVRGQHRNPPGAPNGALPPHKPPCCISALKEDMLKEDHEKWRENGEPGGWVRQSGGGGSSSSHGCASARCRRWPHAPHVPMGPYHSERLLRTWRKVVKLLVAVVLCFALCNLPVHLRKMLTYYHPAYDATADAALLFTPLSNLLMYLNSALNPILYSFMSHNFRACVRDVLTRYTRRGKPRNPSVPLPPPRRPNACALPRQTNPSAPPR